MTRTITYKNKIKTTYDIYILGEMSARKATGDVDLSRSVDPNLLHL